MRSWKLLTIAIALLPCASGAADEITYSSLSIDSDIALASFDAPPSPEIVEPSYNPATVEMLTHPSSVTGPPANSSRWYSGLGVGATRISYAQSGLAVENNRTSMSLRPYLGWENHSGVGVRVQAWVYGVETESVNTNSGYLIYEDGAILNSSSPPFELKFFTGTLDLDLYKRLQFDATSLAVGVGSRIASVGMTFSEDTNDVIYAGGLSTFAQGYHPFNITTNREWGTFGGARISVLSGRADLDSAIIYSRTTGTQSIVQANLGVRYRHHYELTDLVIEWQIEQQLWDTNVFGDLAYTTSDMRLGWEW